MILTENKKEKLIVVCNLNSFGRSRRLLIIVIPTNKMASKLPFMSKAEQERLEKLFYDDCYDSGGILFGPNNHHYLRGYRRRPATYPPLRRVTFYSNILQRRLTTSVRLHVLFYFLVYSKVGEISHKCGDSNCVNVLHLCIEPHKTNCSRRACVVRNFCSGHVGEDEEEKDGGDDDAPRNLCLLAPVWYVLS